ncbi:MAG: hypothetical protein KME29_31280 [Calothrix sp. FI2-JRJ7]|jgi:hypothetical protein|nr:hypothetical protein [Calothrix sp. FI2-JRJ7]
MNYQEEIDKLCAKYLTHEWILNNPGADAFDFIAYISTKLAEEASLTRK